jgi:transcriptional regulator with XRE-family HTH domain
MENLLAQRIQSRLDDLGMTARGASLLAGLGADAVRAMLAGRSKSPRAENLASLARVLKTSAEYLLGETDNPHPNRLDFNQRPFGVPIWDGEFRVGWWQDEAQVKYSERESLMVAPVKELESAGLQYIRRMGDASMIGILPERAWVHLFMNDELGGRPQDGQIVSLIRVRGGLRELTLRLVEDLGDDLLRLTTRPAVGTDRDVIYVKANTEFGVLQFAEPPPQPETLRVEGYAILAYVDLGGTMLVEPGA